MTHRVDIVVVGASLGGVLAAWRAAQSGCKVLLMAEHRWLGGQMTAQAVPPDEHGLIEFGGASQSYLDFRAAIRAHYRAQPGFLDQATLTEGSNPGDGWVSRLCFEPAVAAAWFEALLLPEVQAGRLRVFRGMRAVAATARGADVLAVRFEAADPARGPAVEFHADVFVDATDTGELLALAQQTYRVGKEAASEFGEPDAPERADALDQQPITHVFALRRSVTPGPVVPAPVSYAVWREHRVAHYGHRLFSEALPGRERGVSAQLPLQAEGGTLDWWRYRRIVSAAQWQPPREDITLVNWAQNDYALHPLIDGPRPMHEVLAGARELSQAFLHWLQTEAPRPGGGHGWPEWQPAADVLGTPDGWAMQAYVRESRRIVARDTLTQGHLLVAPAGRPDSVGIGWYNLDIHPTCRSGHGTNAVVQPFELPLGAFIPAQGGNLVPACKNIGVTHLANACTRVHPIEWLIGEVAGVLAAMRWREGWPDRPQQRAALMSQLRAIGVPLHWPDELLARRPASH